MGRNFVPGLLFTLKLKNLQIFQKPRFFQLRINHESGAIALYRIRANC